MSEQQQSQRQRLVVVTGGGTGIGRAIAGVFAAEGARVVLVGRREGVLAEAAEQLQAQAPGGRVVWHRCDVSKPDEVAAFRDWLTNEIGSTVDVIVNNAGGVSRISDGASLQEAAAYAWEELGGNLVGTYLVVHALLPYLRRPGGRIVNISSI
ncbi:MAG TPA: SDR family oxidoreductase, partial [Ktedonobacterales bacterium]